MATALSAELTESQFAQLVGAIAEDECRHHELTELLREENPIYHDRGMGAIVRMRGWLLLALGRVGVSDQALIFVLEELETGMEPYLVAAAARALRSYHQPRESFAPFVLRAIANIRYHDDPISFETYGETDSDTAATSPLLELAETLRWLRPHLRSSPSNLAPLRSSSSGLPSVILAELDRMATALSDRDPSPPSAACCDLPIRLPKVFAWPWKIRWSSNTVKHATFEDQDGAPLAFSNFFHGQPTIVVFFFTRCDNPQKCSLTITKLARVQNLLQAAGLDGQIRTAAITYDPEYDDSVRIRRYGINRGLRLDANHRLLRPTAGFESVRAYFQLGVNYISSVVNRHKIEAFVVNRQGSIAAVFERLQWPEEQVIARAKECLSETSAARRPWQTAAVGNVAALAFVFFPKCPICWSACLSMLGIAGLEKIPYSPWVIIVLGALMLINVASTTLQAWATRRWWPVWIVLAGIGTILAWKSGLLGKYAAVPGMLLLAIGSLNSVLYHQKTKSLSKSAPSPPGRGPG